MNLPRPSPGVYEGCNEERFWTESPKRVDSGNRSVPTSFRKLQDRGRENSSRGSRQIKSEVLGEPLKPA